MRKDVRQFVRKLRKLGVTVRLSGGGHYQATHPDMPGVKVTFPSTAGDWRALHNTRASIKRYLGIII